ncbi:porin family protein [Persicobacter diffluens]|uniref:Outer membrane protein beta-barrel domain-containing protein n=1 Tax=Persicobacter diffluens TaxID=981 RepID=A0AAN4VWA6_9BACT|nr:hypothetical protein PEDI_00170 [Persicobacter diffluens]
MKNTWMLIIAALFCGYQAVAQETSTDNNNQEKLESYSNPQKMARPSLPGSFMVSFGFNNTIGGDNDFRLNWWRSKYFNVSYLYPVPLTEKISFNGGFGIGINNWSFQDKVGIVSDVTNAGAPIVTISDNAGDFPFTNMEDMKRSKLAITYIDIPLEFRYTSKGADTNRGFRAAVGGRVGYRIGGGNSKQTLTGGRTYKAKEDFFLNQWRYGLSSSIGYSWINISFYYGLSDIFEKDQLRMSGDLASPINPGNPYEVGITIDLF